MKNIKNQYVRADSEQKHGIMKILISNCERKGVNTRIYWNKPFDRLFEIGREKEWGTEVYELRTYFLNVRLNIHLKELQLA